MTESGSPGADAARVVAWGDELVRIHNWFRRELAAVGRQLDALLAGGEPAARAEPVRGISDQLRQRCLTVCQMVHFHHTAEDNAVFPHLAADFPELAPVLTRLQREHHVVAELLTRIDTRLRDIGGGGDVAAAASDVKQLTSDLEAHLAYEEEQLVPVLNAQPGAVPWGRAG